MVETAGHARDAGGAPQDRRLARWALLSFLLTFIAARCLVYLIMTGRMPDLFLHVGGTHVHHLNYGIVLLSAVGAVLLLRNPAARARGVCAVLYGIGLGLTFDEFGMWLHLGGPYWQRASFDAVIVVAGVLSVAALAPHPRTWGRRRWTWAAGVAAAVLFFTGLLIDSLRIVERTVVPRMQRLEEIYSSQHPTP